jgi:tetratricopeptide (TPR) repeat protein/TolB-like protein
MAQSGSPLEVALERRYRIERELGTGGMSTVYLAVDMRYDRMVALKVLSPDLTAVVAAKRFLGEIKTTAKLQHPHILPLFDSGEAGGHLYYVMPYVEGESLRQRLDREGELPVDTALRIAGDLARALDYAHHQGVVHRDIKPENVLLHAGQAVISDFGIALAVDAAGATRYTGTGQSIGTPHYMSPEQAAPSGDVDGRSDVYSLACVLHEMLTGEPVFTGPSARIVLAKHLTVPPVPVRKLRPSVPRRVEQAILRALEKSPADRFSTIADFARALERAVPPALSPRAFWDTSTDWLRAHPLVATAAGLVLLGTAVVLAPFLAGPAWTDRPASIAVLPYREETSTEEDAALAIELSDRAVRELMRWDGLSVATPVDLAGPRRSMGLTELVLERVGDGVALAEAVDAEAMLALTVRRRGDTMSVQASLFDSRSRRRVGQPVTVNGPVEEGASVRLMAPVLAHVLGFADAPEPVRAIGAGTGSPEAAVAYLHGRDALERNQLDRAEQLFTRAVAVDSTFASALSFLSQVHFWRGAEDDYFFSLGPEILRWSTAATRYLAGLSPQNWAHVRGFYALQIGNFEEARSRYSSILQADPSDAYALLMLGEVDLLDRWSVRDRAGDLVPRSNLNRARRLYADVVGIDPTFELAYGRIFAIQQQLERSIRRNRSCPGFEELRDDLRPVWERPVPGPGMYPLCPVLRDSIEWKSPSEVDTIDPLILRAGVERLFDRAVNELRRWANLAPEQPRPLELLSEAFLLRRGQLQVMPPERHRTLAAEALDYRVRALALQEDTTTLDLVELANLQLASGDPASAMENARTALARYASGSIRPPIVLMNVLLAGGQTAAALEVVDQLRSDGGMARYVPDPESGENVAVASGGRVLLRLMVLAGSGITGPLLHEELVNLNEAWRAEGYPPRWQQLLRDGNMRSIAPALALDPVAVGQWRDAFTVDDPAWLALSLPDVDPERATLAYERARELELERDGSSHTTSMLAAVAGRLDRHADAVALYSRLDSIPNSVVSFDPAWGLQALSHLLRAEQYLHMADTASAAFHLNEFVEVRAWPDSLSRPQVEHAASLLTALDRAER